MFKEKIFQNNRFSPLTFSSFVKEKKNEFSKDEDPDEKKKYISFQLFDNSENENSVFFFLSFFFRLSKLGQKI
jgi:hypothetical protein